MVRHSVSLAYLLLLCLALAACSPPAGRRVSRQTEPAALPAALARSLDRTQASFCSPGPISAAEVTGGSHIRTVSGAYRDLLADFLRPLDPVSLLNAAWSGATAEAAREEGNDLTISAPLFTESGPDPAWQSFAGSYDALVQATQGRVDQVQMAFAAIAKMAASVAEGHTYFILPDAFAQEGKETHISGIGVTLSGKAPPFVVSDVLIGGPANRAGVLPGDSITAVDGCDTSSLTSTTLSTRVRGTAGTHVHITIDRPSVGPVDFDLVRARITFPALDSRLLADGTGLVRLHSFPAAGTKLQDGKSIGAELDSVLASFRAANARRWILDLRGDPGGRVDGLQAVAGRILPSGAIFSFSDRGGQKSTIVTNGTRITDPPLAAVLVDGGTASAGEILASAVQDEGVATVIGTQTAGVANAAQLVSLADGAGMSITHWQTATVHGRPLNGEGVTPDIQVARNPSDRSSGADAPLDRALQLGR
ncbi:MAG: S41 family peptidase [Dehalococcoidia bacterium]